MQPQEVVCPNSVGDFAAALGTAGERRQQVALFGAGTKHRMAGPVPEAEVNLSTARLTRVLSYEPHDLTLSVEAGIRYAEVARLLEGNRQILPLDPPFAREATMGGILGSASTGPRRRLFGTARDLVIGMTFATLEGKLIQSGGMVVKNVAGLDMAKLMIGSFGTLGAILVANFKVMPRPEVERHFVLSYDRAEEATGARDRVLRSVLQPQSLDLLNPAAAARLGLAGHVLSLQVGGNRAVVERYRQELGRLGSLVAVEEDFTENLREFTPAFLADYPGGAVIRLSTTLSGIPALVDSPAPAIVRAGTGVGYLYLSDAAEAGGILARHAGVVEFSPVSRPVGAELWPAPGSALEIMQRVKQMFDPHHLLNRGRLFGRI